jgi:hypothetical protein
MTEELLIERVHVLSKDFFIHLSDKIPYQILLDEIVFLKK